MHWPDEQSNRIGLLLINDVLVLRLAGFILCGLSFNIKMFISMNKYKDR